MFPKLYNLLCWTCVRMINVSYFLLKKLLQLSKCHVSLLWTYTKHFMIHTKSHVCSYPFHAQINDRSHLGRQFVVIWSDCSTFWICLEKCTSVAINCNSFGSFCQTFIHLTEWYRKGWMTSLWESTRPIVLIRNSTRHIYEAVVDAY